MPERIDQQILPLVDALNSLGFIETISCCGGHPDEKVEGFQYAVANVIFKIEDEPHHLFRWYRFMERILQTRQTVRTVHDFGCAFEKRFSLSEEGTLCWEWALKVEGCGGDGSECRKALDEGVIFLTKLFQTTDKPIDS